MLTCSQGFKIGVYIPWGLSILLDNGYIEAHRSECIA